MKCRVVLSPGAAPSRSRRLQNDRAGLQPGFQVRDDLRPALGYGRDDSHEDPAVHGLSQGIPNQHCFMRSASVSADHIASGVVRRRSRRRRSNSALVFSVGESHCCHSVVLVHLTVGVRRSSGLTGARSGAHRYRHRGRRKLGGRRATGFAGGPRRSLWRRFYAQEHEVILRWNR